MGGVDFSHAAPAAAAVKQNAPPSTAAGIDANLNSAMFSDETGAPVDKQ